MPYIGYLTILDCQSIKNISFGNFFFELPRLESCISRLCPGSLGSPSSAQNTQIGYKKMKGGQIMLHIRYLIILEGNNIEKIRLRTFHV